MTGQRNGLSRTAELICIFGALALVIVGFLMFGIGKGTGLTLQDVKKAVAEAETLNQDKHPEKFGIQRELGTYNGARVVLSYICFGDVCPANGGYYVVYEDMHTREACDAIRGKSIEGYGWGPVWGGCGVQTD